MWNITDATWNRLVVSGAAAALAGVLGFALGAATASGCTGVQDAPFGCAEFVLYRYQTFIGVGGALAAAAITALPVWRQLAEQRRQSAAAVVATLVNAVVALEKERSLLTEHTDKIERAAGTLLFIYDETSWTSTYRKWPDVVTRVYDLGTTLLAKLQVYAERGQQDAELQRCRLAAIAALTEFKAAIEGLDHAFYLQTTGPDYEEGEDDLPPGEAERRRDCVNPARDAWQQSAQEFASSLDSEVKAIWRRIRELEDVAAR